MAERKSVPETGTEEMQCKAIPPFLSRLAGRINLRPLRELFFAEASQTLLQYVFALSCSAYRHWIATPPPAFNQGKNS